MPSDFFSGSLGQNILLALKYIYIVAPIILPIIFVGGLFNGWVSYKREKFWSEQGTTLLEIKLPKLIDKSPLAMEVALNIFFNTLNEATWIDRIWYGKTRPWFSLEIASIGGKLGFFIWTWPGSKKNIENQLYSQFPGIEVHEVADYTLPYAYDPEKNNLWGCEWKLTQKPDALPIKTYVDYGLDSTLIKEEQKIDPMTSVLEYMGSLTEGQVAWIQILIRAHKKERFAQVFGEQPDAWKEEAKAEVKKLTDKMKDKEGGTPLSASEKRKMEAIDRSVGKLPFDVGIRSIYMADKDKFLPSNIGGITGAFRQYNSLDMNGFAPTGWLAGFAQYPWQDMSGRKRELRKKLIVERYKMRRFFYNNYPKMSKPFVLNSEELATIFHFPSQIAAPTPTFERIPSKKSEAPANLPV